MKNKTAVNELHSAVRDINRVIDFLEERDEDGVAYKDLLAAVEKIADILPENPYAAHPSWEEIAREAARLARAALAGEKIA